MNKELDPTKEGLADTLLVDDLMGRLATVRMHKLKFINKKDVVKSGI